MILRHVSQNVERETAGESSAARSSRKCFVTVLMRDDGCTGHAVN